MIGFAEAFGATLATFIIPAFIGMIIVVAASRFLGARYLAVLGVGLYLWFFTDTFGDANLLDSVQGFSGGIWHVILYAVFAIGLVGMFALDRDMFVAGPAGTKLGFAIPVLVALAIGIHGFGEGAGITATAATTPSTNLIDAFGGLDSGVAFTLHKALEPMMVGVAYCVYAKDHAKDSAGRMKDVAVLVLAFTIPGIVGAAIAYPLVLAYPNADFTYVFALGLGTSIYALMRLTRPLFEGTKSDSVRIGLLLLIGFTCLYMAALLHS
jgi:zinc transporter ZupT